MRRTVWLWIAIAMGLRQPVWAQVSYDGCRDIRGIPVVSILDYGINDVAIAYLAPDGTPIIRYNPRVLAGLQQQTQLFFYGHECGHHALGHSFSTTHPQRVEQDADCFGIRELVRAGYIDDEDISIIQYDLSRLGPGDWTHLPGPVRAINLRRCLGQDEPPRPSLAYYCYTQYGSCQLGSPLREGASCYCPSAYGPVYGRAGN